MRTGAQPGGGTVIGRALGGLAPGYFALAMATGIVSLAAEGAGWHDIARALFVLNIGLYVLLWGLHGARLLFAPARFLADFFDHARAPGYFAMVAATCLLGNQFLTLGHNAPAATRLWWFALILWTVVMYAVLAGVTVQDEKPDLQTGLNGAWLLFVVATQALAVLSVSVAPAFSAHSTEMLFFALTLFLVGCMLYIIIISLIFYRWTFFGFDKAAMTPPYWINMGAVAITTRAGATFILHGSAHATFLYGLLPFLRGFTLFFWATATWWIPLLVLLTVWRQVQAEKPFAYDPQYWGMVFPLGMYTACTRQLSQAMGLPFLLAFPRVSIYVALGAWAIGFIGLLRAAPSATRRALAPERESGPLAEPPEPEPALP